MGAPVKHIRGTQRIQVGGNTAPRFKSPIDKAKGYEVIWKQVSPLFEAARRYQDAIYVYFIGEPDDGPIKIGVSKDPIARLRSMQTGNPRRLRIEHVLVGHVAIEKLLHEMWEPYAILAAGRAGKPDMLPGTEWFNPDARATLLPIVQTAAAHQIERLEAEPPATMDDLELIVRQAHHVHGFVPKARDEVRLLAAGPGYVVRRRSRI